MTQSVAQLLQRGTDDLDWLNQNLLQIRKDFNNQFIAINGKRIVANAATLDAVMAELKKKRIDLSNTIVQRISTVRQIL